LVGAGAGVGLLLRLGLLLLLLLLFLLHPLQPNDNPINMHRHRRPDCLLRILNMLHLHARLAHSALDRNPLDQLRGSPGVCRPAKGGITEPHDLQPATYRIGDLRRDAEEESIALVEDPEDFCAGRSVGAGEGRLGGEDAVVLLGFEGLGCLVPGEGVFFVVGSFLLLLPPRREALGRL
jgi:hypothetical protein